MNISTTLKNFITPSFEPSIKQRIAGFDELRGIAVLFVLISHAQLIWGKNYALITQLSHIGVDIFFMVSGYLISTILLKYKGQDNYFRNFYLRRLFRIYPLLFAFIILGVFVAFFYPINDQNPFKVLPYYLTFTQNFITGELNTLPGTSTFWSLAIEEQFYLFLPLIIRFFSAKNALKIIFLICIVSLLCRLYFYQNDDNLEEYTNIRLTQYRIHYLGIGVLLSFKNSKNYILSLFTVWLIAFILIKPNNGILEIPVSIITMLLVYSCIQLKPIIKSTILSHLRKLCFGLYVIHWSVLKVIENFSKSYSFEIKAVMVIIFFIIVYLLSVLSFYLFETPIQNLRTKFEKK